MSNESLGIKGTIFTRKIEGFDVNFVKGNVIFKIQKLEAFDRLIKIELGPNKENHNKYCLETKIIEWQGDVPKIFYALMRLPVILVDDREVVVEMTRKKLSDNVMLYLYESTEHPVCPLRQDRIRMNVIQYTLIEQVGEDLQFVMYQNTDFKGRIPTQLINSMLTHQLSEDVKNIAIQLNE